MAGAATKSARSAGRGVTEKDGPGAEGARRTSPSGDGAPQVAQFTREDELTAYRSMLLIRRFEEKAGQLYGMGFIGGFCHLYIGQEAVVIGMQMATKPGDQV
ncbi:MAG: pyruvate dehydrogenase (acetyl-transferring) E1 component subunit alpha, partial [Hyphomicrobiales bacterium]|nr:pyruvate dehydrogenase (acetyl-transferring) E1 component subunit alpha [Hyphomicrobiales bacterium]